MFYGAPNFGEDPAHDERGFYPVFKPDRPPHMCPVPRDSADIPPGAQIARRMQMVFFRPLKPRGWYGRPVIVTAKIWSWETAWHHTPNMLSVVAIRRAGR